MIVSVNWSDLTHSLDILGHLMHSSNAVRLKNVVVPSVGWSEVVWVGGDCRRQKSIRSSIVLVERDASPERADSWEAGRNEVSAKITEAIADLFVPLPALGVEVERGWWFALDEEHGMVIDLHSERLGHLRKIYFVLYSCASLIERTDRGL